MTCPACRDLGCSLCLPRRSGGERLPRLAHNQQSAGSTPAAATSLEGLIAAAVEAPHYRTEAAWKRDTFPQETH